MARNRTKIARHQIINLLSNVLDENILYIYIYVVLRKSATKNIKSYQKWKRNRIDTSLKI